MTRQQHRFRPEWSSERRVAEAADAERDIEAPNVRYITFCPVCSSDIQGPVYGAYLHGIKRWDGICSACAAAWVHHGGRVAVRWIR